MTGHPTAATLHQAARDDDRRRNGPIANDHIATATDHYHQDQIRYNTDWITAKTPAGRRFEIQAPPPRADYPTFHDWREDVFRWRRLRNWAQSTE